MSKSRTCAVGSCGQPMPTGDNSTACPDCWAAHDIRLGEIPSLVDELMTTLARQTSTGARSGPRSSETPLPYSTAASDAMRLLHSTLWPWVREGLETHPQVPVSDNVIGLAAALMYLGGWLAAHPNGYEAIDEIAYAVDQGRAAIDRAPDLVYAGTCDTDDCGAELYTVAGRSGVLCPVCGALRNVNAWRLAQLEKAADRHLTLAEMTRAISESSEETISRKRLEGWVRRGRLIRAGHIGAVPTYRVGDVLDIIADEHRRTAG